MLLEWGANPKSVTDTGELPWDVVCHCAKVSHQNSDLVGELQHLNSCWTAVCDSQEDQESLVATLKNAADKAAPGMQILIDLPLYNQAVHVISSPTDWMIL